LSSNIYSLFIFFIKICTHDLERRDGAIANCSANFVHSAPGHNCHCFDFINKIILKVVDKCWFHSCTIAPTSKCW